MSGSSNPRQSHLTFLETVRAYELDAARKFLPVTTSSGIPCRLLEVGAGTGGQAQRLSTLGYIVSALEVQGSSYRNVRCFNILEYDGINIPLPNKSHDVVFSSHVLEHVTHLDDVLRETHRVLSDDGVCVHLVPTPSCRAWSLATHYIWLVRRVVQKILIIRGVAAAGEEAPRMPASAGAWLVTLFPPKHGERGNTITEVYYYSRSFWKKKFEKNNFDIVNLKSNHLFYTMANSLGASVSMDKRRFLARFFGSACHIYVLRKKV